MTDQNLDQPPTLEWWASVGLCELPKEFSRYIDAKLCSLPNRDSGMLWVWDDGSLMLSDTDDARRGEWSSGIPKPKTRRQALDLCRVLEIPLQVANIPGDTTADQPYSHIASIRHLYHERAVTGEATHRWNSFGRQLVGNLLDRVDELESLNYNLSTELRRRWREVTVVAGVGSRFGVLSDEDGVLVMVTGNPDGSWPTDAKPEDGKWLEILEGNSRYTVTADHGIVPGD